jgi:hypothetical protein
MAAGFGGKNRRSARGERRVGEEGVGCSDRTERLIGWLRCGVGRSTLTGSKVAPNFVQLRSFYCSRDFGALDCQCMDRKNI